MDTNVHKNIYAQKCKKFGFESQDGTDADKRIAQPYCSFSDSFFFVHLKEHLSVFVLPFSVQV